jgi:hypothetical protein
MVQPLDSAQVELCSDECGAESCFLDEFIRRVGREGETSNCGCARGTCAAHDYG